MFGMAKTLIVVYKDEMLMNQLKKLVETNDDGKDGQVVGTADDSINIVSWNEKVWLGNKKAGNIKDKVLFLGDIKGTEDLIPVVDIQFDEYGVKYGWAGNQAILFADAKALDKREDYALFVQKLAAYPVPEIIKQPVNLNDEEKTNVAGDEEITVVDKQENNVEENAVFGFLKKAKSAILTGAEAVGKAGSALATMAEDVLRDKNAVKRQMLFYGVVNLYKDGLEKFMNM